MGWASKAGPPVSLTPTLWQGQVASGLWIFMKAKTGQQPLREVHTLSSPQNFPLPWFQPQETLLSLVQQAEHSKQKQPGVTQRITVGRGGG